MRGKAARRLIGLLGLLLLTSCSRAPGQMVVARVNGEKIRAAELQTALAEETSYEDPEVLSHPEILQILKMKALNSLIHERLLLQEAKQRRIRLTPEEKEALSNQLNQGYDPKDLEGVIRKKGISTEEWLRLQEKRFLIEKVIQEIITASLPNEAEIEKEYRTNRSKYQEPERAHCRQIVTSNREKAEKILSLLQKGENFAQLAKEYSESPDREKGGDLGWVARGDLPAIMEEACLQRLAVGETSSVVTSAYGYHILRVLERRPAHQLTLAEARPLIVRTWIDEKRQEVVDQWLIQKKQGSEIQIDEEALKKISWTP